MFKRLLVLSGNNRSTSHIHRLTGLVAEPYFSTGDRIAFFTISGIVEPAVTRLKPEKSFFSRDNDIICPNPHKLPCFV